MTDFLGKQLVEGQEVVYLYQASNGGEYRLGIVAGFTEKMVKIRINDNFIIRKAPHLCIVVYRGRDNEN